jgi:hypothetical protein
VTKVFANEKKSGAIDRRSVTFRRFFTKPNDYYCLTNANYRGIKQKWADFSLAGALFASQWAWPERFDE